MIEQEAMAALAQPVTEWIGEAAVESPPPARVVFSATMPPEWSDRILAEMVRRGLENPSQLIKVLVGEGLDRAEGDRVNCQ